MQATCYPNHCFCESLHAGGIFQPANAISSLAFVIAGIYIAFRYRNSWGYGYAMILALIGFGSGYYHARLDFIGQMIDNAGMYLLVTFVLLSVVERTRKTFWAYFIASNAVLLSVITMYPILRRYIFAGIVLILITVLSRRNILKKYFWSGFVVMAVATIIWSLDFAGVWCSPDSWLQGHAVWHILGAVSAVLLFKSIQPLIKSS